MLVSSSITVPFLLFFYLFFLGNPLLFILLCFSSCFTIVQVFFCSTLIIIPQIWLILNFSPFCLLHLLQFASLASYPSICSLLLLLYSASLAFACFSPLDPPPPHPARPCLTPYIYCLTAFPSPNFTVYLSPSPPTPSSSYPPFVPVITQCQKHTTSRVSGRHSPATGVTSGRKYCHSGRLDSAAILSTSECASSSCHYFI